LLKIILKNINADCNALIATGNPNRETKELYAGGFEAITL